MKVVSTGAPERLVKPVKVLVNAVSDSEKHIKAVSGLVGGVCTGCLRFCKHS